MLLDLGRNDVGKVSKINSIKVTEKFRIEKILTCNAYCFPMLKVTLIKNNLYWILCWLAFQLVQLQVPQKYVQWRL